ncbi:hypothetical protein CEXT_429871 [Caerostris extrusa]|uniref:Uncharacterized protein n=1 Tax=Caerostris extrusa TaxID=172846 RepID=A0AAV4X3Q2_CAEEX|nr:hypothetical protein CEXT_429871 [Caerostris extrusa]
MTIFERKSTSRCQEVLKTNTEAHLFKKEFLTEQKEKPKRHQQPDTRPAITYYGCGALDIIKSNCLTCNTPMKNQKQVSTT